MTPTVSVVIPVFNCASTIDAALASIRGQIRQPDEVVIVDDASEDDTIAHLRQWTDLLPITLIENARNRGCGASRKVAVAAAAGDIIAPLDADDVWFPDHLSTVVPLAIDPQLIVATRFRRWQPHAGLDLDGAAIKRLPAPPEQPEAILRFNFLFSGSLAWRDAIMAVGGGSSARRADDWETWIRLIVEGGCRAVAAPRPTLLYRAHFDSLSVLDGCLPEEVALYETLLLSPAYKDHRKLLQASLRRRLARRELLDGARAAAEGAYGDARRAFARAIVADPSLDGFWQDGGNGSVALRAAVGLVSPSLAHAVRQRLLKRKALIAEPPALATTRERTAT